MKAMVKEIAKQAEQVVVALVLLLLRLCVHKRGNCNKGKLRELGRQAGKIVLAVKFQPPL